MFIPDQQTHLWVGVILDSSEVALLAATPADVTGYTEQGILEHRDSGPVFLGCGNQTSSQRAAHWIAPFLRHPLAQPFWIILLGGHTREFLERPRHLVLGEEGPVHFPPYLWHEYLRVVHQFLEVPVEAVLNLR